MAQETLLFPDIDPTFLESSELEYELLIREVVGLKTNRAKTQQLRDWLKSEKKGERPWPDIPPINAQYEENLVKTKLEELSIDLDDAINENREYDILRVQTRLRHYWERGLRIVDRSEDLKAFLVETKRILEDAYVRENNKDTEKLLAKAKITSTEQVPKVLSNVSSPIVNQAASDEIDQFNANLRRSLGRGRGKGLSINNVSHLNMQNLVNSLPGERLVRNPNTLVNNTPPRPALGRDKLSLPNTDSLFGSATEFRPKAVPVYKWNVRFSGEPNTTSLMDFLVNLDLMAQSEGCSKTEILNSIHFLLVGQARNWYIGNRRRLHTWDVLIEEMKKEFLPINYDFLVREDVMNRVQQPTESFSHFMTHMRLLFDKVYPPYDEHFKMYIVKRNMLPKYSFQLSTTLVRSLDDLIMLCRQMDEAKLIESRRNNPLGASVMEPSCFPSHVGQNIQKRVSEIYHAPTSGCSSSVMEIRPAEINGRRPRGACWNCEQTGHRHYDCPSTNVKIFCWFCGRKDVTSNNCPRNHTLVNRRANNQPANDLSGNPNQGA